METPSDQTIAKLCREILDLKNENVLITIHAARLSRLLLIGAPAASQYKINHLKEQLAFMERRCEALTEQAIVAGHDFTSAPLWRRLYLAFFPGAAAR